MDESSSLDAFANDHQIPNPAISLRISIQYNEASPEKHLTENAETNHETEKAQNGKRKRKHKIEMIDLPRRASKRLAGIKVDPVPELKSSRAREVSINNQSCDSTTKNEYCYEKLAIEENGTNKDQECFSFLPLKNKDGEKVDGKLVDYSLDFPLEEILKDPCIALAVQILTGDTFETYYKNSQLRSESLAATEGPQNIDAEQQQVSSLSENLTIPKECIAAADDEIGHTDKGNENSEPCLELAIKTLNDSGSSTIPIDTDSNFKNFLQQQLSSSNSNAQEHCEIAL